MTLVGAESSRVSERGPRKRRSDGWRWRVRYTIASAGLSFASPENAASVLAESSAEIEASPGVSMRLIDRRAEDGHSITMRSRASAESSPSEIEIAPPSRERR